MDYNIYIHNGSDGTSQTSPSQLKESGNSSLTEGAFSNASTLGSFISNPDSIFGNLKSSAVGGLMAYGGYIGLIAIAISKLKQIVNSTTVNFLSVKSIATGNYKPINTYNNWSSFINNVTNPINTMFEHQKATLEIRKQNAMNEQESMLFGGSVINSPYGRYV